MDIKKDLFVYRGHQNAMDFIRKAVSKKYPSYIIKDMLAKIPPASLDQACEILAIYFKANGKEGEAIKFMIEGCPNTIPYRTAIFEILMKNGPYLLRHFNWIQQYFPPTTLTTKQIANLSNCLTTYTNPSFPRYIQEALSSLTHSQKLKIPEKVSKDYTNYVLFAERENLATFKQNVRSHQIDQNEILSNKSKGENLNTREEEQKRRHANGAKIDINRRAEELLLFEKGIIKPMKKNKDPSKVQNVLISSFKFLKKLGNGAQGEVYLVEKLDGVDAGTVYALKVFEKAKALACDTKKQFMNNELMVLKKIAESPFLTTMVYALQSSNYLYIAMEFEQGGDLFSMFQKKPLTIFETKFVIAEVIMAIEELHKHNILYRDLKLENILFDKNGHLVLCDMGLAYDTVTTHPDHVVRLAGTINYLPPEAMDAELSYGLSFDWWTVGILTHELLTQKVPYKNTNISADSMKDEIAKGNISIDECITGDARDFIMKLLKKDVASRLGSRNGATDLKKHQFFNDINWHFMELFLEKSPFARTFINKYDTSLFDEEYTSAPIDFQDDSSIDDTNCVEGFFYMAPHLVNNPLHH